MPQPVDLRGLDPPEPLLRILAAIDSGAAGPLVFWLSREPYPLYPLLGAAGWRHSVRRGEGPWCSRSPADSRREPAFLHWIKEGRSRPAILKTGQSRPAARGRDSGRTYKRESRRR
jgi:hypothetical protein